MEEYEQLKLTNINNGAVEDLFNEELDKVMRNVNDLNVNPDAIREIRITLKIKPSKDRLTATTELAVSSRLAANVSQEGSIFFSFRENKPKAFANNYKQMTMEDLQKENKENEA